MKLYYSSITQRKDGWHYSEGYVMSDNIETLQIKIRNMPKFDEHRSWEYDAIKSFETTEEKHQLFIARSKDGILWIDDFEIDKYR